MTKSKAAEAPAEDLTSGLVDEDPKPITAEDLYAAYREVVRHHQALPMPEYHQLDAIQQGGWVAAAERVGAQ